MSADIVSQLRGEVFVPVVQTADFSHSDNLAGGGRRRRPMLRRILVEAEVGALPMVVVDERADGPKEVGFAEGHDPRQTLGPDRLDKSLGIRIQIRTPGG